MKSNRLLCRPRDQEYVGGQSATGSFKPLMGMGKLVPKKHEKKPVTGDPTQIYVRFEHDLATVRKIDLLPTYSLSFISCSSTFV